MPTSPRESKQREYDVALSFAGEDRDYVDRVASALVDADVSVFYDRYEEATLWGKNLYEHLRHIYTEAADFTVMFVSEAYSKKLWTTHERESAQARAFEERREYILPARFDNVEIPGLPKTTGYIDLRNKTPEELAALLLQKLGRSEKSEKQSATECLRTNPLFAAALAELEEHNSISIAILEAILALGSPPENLATFLTHINAKSQGWARSGLGRFAITCIGEFNIGYEAVDECLRGDVLDDEQRAPIAMDLQYVTRPEVIRWAHRVLTEQIRNDTFYNSFLQKHSSFVLESLHSEMTAYLLVPNRGPGIYNIDSLFLAAKKSKNPEPFILRIGEWIRDGYFAFNYEDSEPSRPGKEVISAAPFLLYSYLTDLRDTARDHPIHRLRTDAVERVRYLLLSTKTQAVGLHHLYLMVSENFEDIEEILRRVYASEISNIHGRQLLLHLRSGITDENRNGIHALLDKLRII